MAVDNQKVLRHEELKARLQGLYGGRAQEYDPRGSGTLYAPHGACPVKTYMQVVDGCSDTVRRAEQKIAQLETELREKHPYVPIQLHPMMVLPGCTGDAGEGRRTESARGELFRKIGLAQAERRMAEEHLAFWRAKVRPVSDACMSEIRSNFAEKAKLREELLLEENVCIEPW